MPEPKSVEDDPEFLAMQTIHNALKPLDQDARGRVLGYVRQRLGMADAADVAAGSRRSFPPTEEHRETPAASTPGDEVDASSDAISPVALKWMKRAGLSKPALAKVFSIDLDQIELVTSEVPGENKRERLHNVFRLLAMAEYVATGAARVSHDELKEACLHYDAYDTANHAAGLKKLGREISGTKESGYTLTPAGITEATKLIKEMTLTA